MKGNNLVSFYYMLISNFLAPFDVDAKQPFHQIELRKLGGPHIEETRSLFLTMGKDQIDQRP